jgi:hypothetical protein
LDVLAPQAKQVESVRKAISGMLQRADTLASFAGDSEVAMAAFDEYHAMHKNRARADADDHERLAASRAEDAIEAIVAQARKHQVVILNEAHHVP